MKEKFWIVPNILSLLRIILTIPISVLLLKDNEVSRWLAFGFIIIAAFTDIFDGYFARKYYQVSELGKILDPIADKIAVGVISGILTFQDKIPLWFFVAIIGRDVLIFSGGVYLKKAKDIVPISNQMGKWAVIILGIFLIMAVLDFKELFLIKEVLLYTCLTLLILSFVLYIKRFVNLINNNSKSTL